MANSYFQFKQFTILQDRCAMKVGTDGVLLGAWTLIDSKTKSILDVGTGTGLVALMLAQRCDAQITALEIMPEAASQADENRLRSPWSEKIEVVNTCFKSFAVSSLHRYEVIACNPPYFFNSLQNRDLDRTNARHTALLDFESLVEGVACLLAKEGRFSVIIPTESTSLLIELAAQKGLFLHRRTDVKTTPQKAAKRTLLAFGWQEVVCEHDELIIELSRHNYSNAYVELTSEYYLDL